MNLEIDCDERLTRLQVRLCRSCKAWETFFFLRFSCLRYLCVWHHTDQRSIVISLRKSQRSGTATVEIIKSQKSEDDSTWTMLWQLTFQQFSAHWTSSCGGSCPAQKWLKSIFKLFKLFKSLQISNQRHTWHTIHIVIYIYILLYITIVQSSRKDSQGKRTVAWQFRSPDCCESSVTWEIEEWEIHDSHHPLFWIWNEEWWIIIPSKIQWKIIWLWKHIVIYWL